MPRNLSQSINTDTSALVIIDIQQKLVKAMDQNWLEAIIKRIDFLVTFACETSMPIILTEQYPQGLGSTIEPINRILDGKKFSLFQKTSFGCCGDEDFWGHIKKIKKTNIILTGMEAHICVYLTALGLTQNKHNALIMADAIISRETNYYQNALDLMKEIGCSISNSESVVFEMMKKSGTPLFKTMSGKLKSILT